MQDKSLLYLYDLPKEKVTSTQIATKIKELTGYEIADPQIRRDPNKPFYTAIIKINDPEKFKQVALTMKYFDIIGKPCRALPYDRDLPAPTEIKSLKTTSLLKRSTKTSNLKTLKRSWMRN